jgi:hypothetical protein
VKLTLNRFIHDDKATFGVLSWPGGRVFTLEDAPQSVKIMHRTRIPAGTYDLSLRQGSPMARKHAERYGSWHLGMIWLLDVPGFEYVYIHPGNWPDDTSGCILPAMSAAYSAAGAMHVRESSTAYMAVAPGLMRAIMHGPASCSIEITDEVTA